MQTNDNKYNLRSQNDLNVPTIKTVWKGENSIRYFGALLWNSIPSNIENSDSLSMFKSKMKNWQPFYCPCRLCRLYIDGVGFVEAST